MVYNTGEAPHPALKRKLDMMNKIHTHTHIYVCVILGDNRDYVILFYLFLFYLCYLIM